MDKRITAEQLKELLNKGEVTFSFEKKDGSIRRARGTRKSTLIPFEHLPKGEGSNSSAVAFYDLEKSEWRSVSAWAPVFA